MSTPTFPAGRYGRRRSPARTPRWVVPALLCLVLVATSVLALNAYRRQASDVQGAVRSYEVTAEGVRMTIEVTKPPNQPATCILRARAADGAVVGQLEASLASAPRRVSATLTVPTDRRAVTGEVVRCTLSQN